MSAAEHITAFFLRPRATSRDAGPRVGEPRELAADVVLPERLASPVGGPAGLALVPHLPPVPRARAELRLVDANGVPAGGPVPAAVSAAPTVIGDPAVPTSTVDAADPIRVCVVGDERVALAVARALAAALARRRAARRAVLCRNGEAPGGGGRGSAGAAPASRAARRAAQALQKDGLTASARGRVVEVEVRGAAPDASVGLLLAGRMPGEPVVTVLATVDHTRPEADGGTFGLVVLALPAAAPASLAELAIAELRAAVPGARVIPIAVPDRFGLAARRAVVAQALMGLS